MPGQARHVVGVRVRDEDARDLLPAEVQPAQADLRALPAVEEEQLPFPAQEDRCQSPAGQGHHAARAENEYFEVHAAAVSYSGRSRVTLPPSSGTSTVASARDCRLAITAVKPRS